MVNDTHTRRRFKSTSLPGPVTLAHTQDHSCTLVRLLAEMSPPTVPLSGLVQNAGRGEIAGRDRTQVQNAGVRDPFHGLSALPKIHGTGSGPAGLHGIRGTTRLVVNLRDVGPKIWDYCEICGTACKLSENARD